MKSTLTASVAKESEYAPTVRRTTPAMSAKHVHISISTRYCVSYIEQVERQRRKPTVCTVDTAKQMRLGCSCTASVFWLAGQLHALSALFPYIMTAVAMVEKATKHWSHSSVQASTAYGLSVDVWHTSHPSWLTAAVDDDDAKKAICAASCGSPHEFGCAKRK